MAKTGKRVTGLDVGSDGVCAVVFRVEHGGEIGRSARSRAELPAVATTAGASRLGHAAAPAMTRGIVTESLSASRSSLLHQDLRRPPLSAATSNAHR